jgi:transposase InsO family protein
VRPIQVLKTLFAAYGVPLVIKFEDGSAFIAGETSDLLARHGVEKLLSPPGMPRYNGSCEAIHRGDEDPDRPPGGRSRPPGPVDER